MQNMLGMLPFNISLLVLTAESTRGMKPIKVLDIFETAGGKEFHRDGLFSTEIFGKIGDERRNRLFAYIDLRVKIFHPVIFKQLVSLKELYGGIMAGTAYAVFDTTVKDFVAATPTTGRTGYSFFLEHFEKIEFERRESTSREFAINLIDKERKNALMDKFLVMPAGLRDFTVLPNGKPEEDEINTLYRRILSTANVIGQHNIGNDASYIDATRYSLQIGVQNIYAYIVNLLEGKGKLIQGWWTSRKIFHSTRNVITSNVQRVNQLYAENTVGPNHTVVGLYQTSVAIFPLAVNLIRNMLSDVFTGPNTPANLVNAKTLEREVVSVRPESYDEWMTQEGLEQQLGRFDIEALRHEPIMVEGKYLALIYNDGTSVKILHDINDVPEKFDKKHVKPITYTELYYLAIYRRVKELAGFVTRYPITGFGSIYPSFIYLRTTTRSKIVTVLNEQWEPVDKAPEFPIRDQPFVNSMSPATTHLVRLTAD